jgi:hypothetical protein
MQAEMEKEDEEEEKEVEEFIVTDDAVVDRISDEREGLDEDDDSMDEAGGNPAAEEVTSSWRKKIDVVKIWPFTSGSSPQFKDGDEEEEDITDVCVLLARAHVCIDIMLCRHRQMILMISMTTNKM